MKTLYLAAAVAALVSTPAFAAASDTKNGSATAVVIAPLTLTHTSGAALNFGSFTAAAGTVTVKQDGTGSASGPTAMVGTTYAADEFSVAGDGSRTFSISTKAGTVTLSGGTTTMDFTPSAPATGTLSSGAATFSVGGTLTVVGTEGAGTYNGSYSVTVAYN